MHEQAFGNLLISDDPARLQFEVIHAYLAGSYWADGIPAATVEKSLFHSLCLGAYVDGAQVGLVRLVTDRATFAYLCDVFVLEEHRGRGISRRLMEMTMSHPDLTGLRRLVLVTRDAHGVYAKYGFQPLENPAGYMELRRPGIYRQAVGPLDSGKASLGGPTMVK